MPATYTPDVVHFGEAAVSSATVSDDRRSVLASAGGIVTLPPADMGSGRVLASVAEVSAAVDVAITGRTSAAVIPHAGDSALILPGSAEWRYTYDPALGTLPSSQGFTSAGTAPTLSGGLLTAASAVSSYSAKNPSAFVARKYTVIKWQLRRNAGHASQQGVWLNLPLTGLSLYQVYVRGTDYGAAAGQVWGNGGGNGGTGYMPGLVMAVGEMWDFALVVRSVDGVACSGARLWAAPTTAARLSDYGEVVGATGGANYLFWHYSPSGTTDCTWGGFWAGDLATVDAYGYEAITSGATGTRNQRYHQIRLTLPTGGTLTGVDMRSDGAAPSAPTVSATGTIGANATSVLIMPGAGSEAVRADLIDTSDSSVVASRAAFVDGSDPVALAAGGIANGTYRWDVSGASDGGVPTAAVSSSSFTLPAVAPSVALTISAATVAPGGTVTASAVLAGGATATNGGVSWDGSSATIVTGIAGSATAPTIGPYPRFVSGVLRFYKPTAGTGTPTYYKVLSSTNPNGAYAVALSAAWGGITWQATDGTGEYVTATALGLTVGETTWYTDQVIADDSTSATGATAVYGGDDAGRLCVVSFDLGTGYASRTVGILLSGAVTVRGGTFARSSYDVTLDASGVGSVSLPRLNAGTYTDGSEGVPYAIVDQSKGVVLRVLVPDASSATFSGLTQA